MTATYSTKEHLNELQVFNSGDKFDRDVLRRDCPGSFLLSDKKSCLFPTYLDHKQRAEGSNSTLKHQSVLSASPSSIYFNYSSVLQPFFTPQSPYSWSPLGRHAGREGPSVLPNQRRRNQFRSFPASQSALELNPLPYEAEISTELANIESVIETGISGRGKSKPASRRLSSTNYDCSSSINLNTEIKQDSKPRRKRKPVEVKDERYWKKRAKNNLAAKKSRDTKRKQELYTQKIATFLETENARLHLELSNLRQENRKLKRFLSVFVKEEQYELT